MTEQTDHEPEVLEVSPEQASTNYYWTFGKQEVFHLQSTFRGILDPLQIQAHLESVKFALKQTVEMGGHAKPPGKDTPAPRPDPAYANAVTTQVVPPPAPVQAGTNGSGQAHCIMLEVGTSYAGGKTQLSFVCDGLEHPLRYTKPIGEMVKLLSPLGYTAEYLVVGKKYGVSFTVHYTESSKDGKTYKNVQSVTA